MTCPCDQPSAPAALDIAPGLTDLPRQRWSFVELRTAMLDRARWQAALAEWRARAPDDYGVMWLEMMAYVGELVSLYDKAIADESYVRTAKLRPSLRRLLGVLGYVPRPAVAAEVELALIADGAQPVTLPVGTGFRSGAFAGQPPQVFELVAPATIHPALDKWPVVTPAAPTLTGQVTTLLLDPATARVAVGDVVLVELSAAAADAHVRTVAQIARTIDAAGRRVAAVTLDRAVDCGAGKAVAGIAVRKASRAAALKVPSAMGGDLPSFGWFFATFFFLDGVYREARVGERCLVTLHGETRWFTIQHRDEWALVIDEPPDTPEVKVTVDGDADAVVVPARAVEPVRARFTLISGTDSLDAASRKASASSESWYGVGGDDTAGFTLGLGLVSAGKVLGPAVAAVVATDPLAVAAARAPVGSVATTDRLVFRDHEARVVAVDGSVDLASRAIALVAGVAWTPGLAPPLVAYGNVVTAVRGETVAGEVLGSGDAAATMQRWKLAKAPLTYQAVAGAGDAAGVASSLRVWVDGLAWTEVPSFYGQGPDAQVYIVRQDDRGDSWVTFGDGVRGARLPSGAGNVVAAYRFGAGAASPPAGSVTQLARPVPGLASVGAALAAGGGADAEPAESLRELAPRSALLLGRAISIDDMEVAARLAPGVSAARADWAWDGVRQRPVVKVWILGGAGVRAAVEARLLALAEPDTPIAVADATPVVATLAIDLEIDPCQVATAVLATVTAALFGDDGWLTPPVLGIDRPLLRSRLLADLLTIPGVTGVRALTWNGAALLDYGVAPGPGAYFDLAATAAVTGS